METPVKNCIVCKKLIVKKQNWSVRSWRERVKYCSISCRYKGMRGKIPSIETRKKMSLAHMGNKSNTGRKFPLSHIKNMSECKKGNKHWNWKGGLTKQNHLLRNSLEYKLWQKAVFTRDYWTCVWCGYKGKNIHADHIQEFAYYPELRFAIDNGRTLCKPCHILRHKKSKLHGNIIYSHHIFKSPSPN